MKEKYKVVSSRDSVQGECQRHSISFRSDKVRKRVGKKVLDEWMFPCNPSARSKKKLIYKTFCVSRAYADDKAFVYQRTRRGKMFAIYYLYNTGVIDAEGFKQRHAHDPESFPIIPGSLRTIA